MLVSTSIIESGIDIPQANTLIVERSDIFGLSQLYQIRGRVGRSRERAYAYLLYPSAGGADARRPPTASRRSRTTPSSASGFKIAMRDLELRGAGNLLGDEQSGHVAALGFELYMQMLDEAVRAMGDGAVDEEDLREPVRLDVNVDAYVPADYIPYEQAKVDVHRRIAGAREVAELAELRAELTDRFGEPPEPLENLLALQQARIKLGQAGASGGHVPPGPARGHPDRARLRAGQEAARGDPRRALRIGQVAALACACPTTRPSASRPSCGPRTRCSPSRRGRLTLLDNVENTPATLGSRYEDEDEAVCPGAWRLFCARIHRRRVRRGAWQRRRDVDGTAIEKTDFDHWLTVASKSGGQAGAAAPKPPDYDGVRRAEAQDDAEAGQGPAEGHRRASSRPSASRSTTRCATRSCSC